MQLKPGWTSLRNCASFSPVIAFGALEVTDGFLTFWATSHQFQEINYLMAGIASSWVFPLFKLGIALLAIAILRPVARRFPKQVNFAFTVISGFLLIVIVSNVFEILA